MADCVLVTGANGFLGSEIIRQCRAGNISVRGSDLHEKSRSPDVPYYQADIVSTAGIHKAVEGVSCVIHAAGLAHIFKKSRLPVSFKAVNEGGTASVAQAASEAGVRHFILISSVSVYGESCSGADETAACSPSGDYAASKLNAEQRSMEIASASDMHLTILRLATLYGEEDPGNVARLMRAVDRRLFLWIGDGSNKKSLIHREDAARACIAATQSTPEKMNMFNVSAGEYTMREIVGRLAESLGRNVPEWSIPPSVVLSLTKALSVFPPLNNTFTRYHGVIKKWLADDYYNATKFEKNCGFKAEVDLAKGLHQEVAWYRNRNIV